MADPLTMRVLDLGCHDGYVSLWLGRRLRERGVEPTFCGVDLMPAAAEKAQTRLAAEGFAADFRVAAAEDADGLWPMGTFDAVLCFELVEHVEDVPELLDVCEVMLRPGGRVYVSTPDGTFGEGKNPHHLRCWTAHQLVELLRRRGRLADATVGADTITSVAYEPATPRGEAVIHTAGGWERWNPLDIATKGLGGSETAAAHVARCLADRGWTVTVYGEVDRGVHAQVVYEHLSAFDPTRPCDLFIGSRAPELADSGLRARRKVLWLHDVDCGDRLTEERAAWFDQIAVLSDWQHGHVRERYPWLDEAKLLRTRNGIDPALFDAPAPWADRPPVALYTSSPDRGLDFLARIWRKVREHAPDAELHHAYAPVYDRVADQDPVIGAFRDELRALLDRPGVVNLGHLPQPGVARAMMVARAWLHPSWATPYGGPFHETYSIGALEAQAAGCVRVASDWGALAERDLEHEIADLDEELWARTIVEALTGGPPPTERRDDALATTWDDVAAAFDGPLIPAGTALSAR